MRFLVLSRQRRLYAMRRFRETALGRGHALRVVDPLSCTLALDQRGPRLYAGSREVGDVDCAIPRVGTLLASYALSVVSHLESMGVPTVNRSEAIARARDKLLALQLLAKSGLAVPRTALVRDPARLDRALAIVGGPPAVLKLIQGAQGVGVMLAETRDAVESTLETLWGLGQTVVLQEFVSESRGRDVRALVVGGRVVTAMRRLAREGEWRSNIHCGGSGEVVELVPAFQRAAIEAVRVLGLEVAGVDLLEGRDGPRIMEVNASPGFEELERVTGVDIAEAILRHAERIAGRRTTAREVSGFTL